MIVYAGAVAPQAYVLKLRPAVDPETGLPEVDLSLVTTAVILVRGPNRRDVEWSVDKSNQTATTLTLTRLFEASDIPKGGLYSLFALLDVPGGKLRSETRWFVALGPFDTVPQH